MKLKTLKCPECGASIGIEEGRDFCFCSYCGSKVYLDDEKLETTHNENINITTNINKTSRHIDDAKVEKTRADDKKDKRSYIFISLWWGALALIILGVNLYFAIAPKIAESQGKISAGYYKDLIGESYEVVEAHFEAAGFTDIELIDLNDSGIAFWNKGKVKTISIGGDTKFSSEDWFYPDTKVVISYH